MTKSTSIKQDLSFGSVVFTEVEKEVRFLLLRHLPGHWSFPKGHPEADEIPHQTAQREFSEETGIYQALSFVDGFEYPINYQFHKEGTVLEKTVVYFLASINFEAVQVQAGEIDSYCWLPFAKAEQRITYPEAREVLRAANHYLPK